MNSGVIDMAGNPFNFVLKGLVAAKRERNLNNAELVKLIPWMRDNYSDAVRDALMLTLLCGVRSGEACAIEAHEIEDLPDGMVWTIPKIKSKTGVAFNVMCPTQAAHIIRKRLESHPTGWLFPSRSGRRSIAQKNLGTEVWIHSSSCTIDRYRNKTRCPVNDWAPHDLRRTCRTNLSRMGCTMEVAEAILNHTKVGVRANYDLYGFDREKREWLQRWADHLDALTGSDNIMAFAQRKTG